MDLSRYICGYICLLYGICGKSDKGKRKDQQKLIDVEVI